MLLYEGFFGNLILAITTRTICAEIILNRLSAPTGDTWVNKVLLLSLFLLVVVNANAKGQYARGQVRKKVYVPWQCLIPFSFKLMGDSRKYPYPTTGDMSILTPPCPRKFQKAYPPLPSEFQNR